MTMYKHLLKSKLTSVLVLGSLFLSVTAVSASPPPIGQAASGQAASGQAASGQAASGQAASNQEDTGQVETALHASFPKLVIQGLHPVEQVKGLYEFSVNGQKAYTPITADYVLVGELLVKQGDKVVNLTQATIEKDRSALFGALPLDRAIKIVYGKGERKLAIFEDPSCPFCQAFEHDLSTRGADLNATVYVFLFPIASLHPNATAQSEYFWCSKDSSQAWSSWMSFAAQRPNQDSTTVWSQWLASTGRPAAIDCGDRGQKLVQGNIDLGHKYGFHQTPILLFSNGTMWPGALSMDKLEKAFSYATESASGK